METGYANQNVKKSVEVTEFSLLQRYFKQDLHQ